MVSNNSHLDILTLGQTLGKSFPKIRVVYHLGRLHEDILTTHKSEKMLTMGEYQKKKKH